MRTAHVVAPGWNFVCELPEGFGEGTKITAYRDMVLVAAPGMAPHIILKKGGKYICQPIELKPVAGVGIT